MKPSPFAPAALPQLPEIAGVQIGISETGIRYKGRPDLMLMTFAPGTSVAGVFTTSTTYGPPVEWCREHSGRGRIRAVVANAGNSNTFTGDLGRSIVRATAEAAAAVLACSPIEVFISSTGVIGEPPPADKLITGVGHAFGTLAPCLWHEAARAIMTTDTYPKVATRAAHIDGLPVCLNGIAKGSGMIAPNMATMLVYLATDAAITPPALRAMLSRAVEQSFNAITVDSDTSTSDTLLLAATSQIPHEPIADANDVRAIAFQSALDSLCLDLAQQVVKDGEGATKFIAITVKGSTDDRSARQIAFSVANSPLFKTAAAGGDPNWGRIVMAVGKSGIPLEQRFLSLTIGGIPVAKQGRVAAKYDETQVVRHMAGSEIDVIIEVGSGLGRATVWTCDLTQGYIDINASYRS
jgi:glutamate N-acetyltransferase / amino-acid N-acetyltransferase